VDWEYLQKELLFLLPELGKMIQKLGDDQVKFNLALSLHAANDKKRSEIMEINDSN
jgi:23S rRNA (adenine2503-C2)-methyltransferase